MILTRCVMVSIVLTVLSLLLPACSAVKVIQPYRVVSTNGTAQVQCFIHPRPALDQSLTNPSFDSEELRVTLLKGLDGDRELCLSILNFTDQRGAGVEREGGVQCSAQLREGAVEVAVSGLKSTDTDVYRCKIEVFYPPPYLQFTGNGTLIHVLDSSDCPVQGAQTQIAHQGGDEEEDDEADDRMAPVSVSLAVVVIVVTVILLIIICIQAVQCERGRRDPVRPTPGVLHKSDAAAFSLKSTV